MIGKNGILKRMASALVLTSVFVKDGHAYDADRDEMTMTPLLPPMNVTASDDTLACGIRITWNAVAEAEGYAIYRSASASGGSMTRIAVSLAPAYLDVEAPSNKTLYYSVKALHSTGCDSDMSACDRGSRKLGTPLYVVVDLGSGPTAESYPIIELANVPSGGWTDEYKTAKLVLRRVPEGSFSMGCETNETGYAGYEAKPHLVTISKPFYMGVFEITQRQYRLVTGVNPSSCWGEARPVENVYYETIRGCFEEDWWPVSNAVDVASFMGKICARTGLAFDLPTEAQWEYACRAGTTSALNNGCNLTNKNADANMSLVGRYGYNGGQGEIADTTDESGGKHAVVGSYKPNAWGLYDMHGNVYEWCLDWFASRATHGFDMVSVTDPKGSPAKSYHVLRGGSWRSDAQHCRSAARGADFSMYTASDSRGFRLCCPAGP